MARIIIAELNTVENNVQALSNTELDATKGGLLDALKLLSGNSNASAGDNNDNDGFDFLNGVLSGGILNRSSISVL